MNTKNSERNGKENSTDYVVSESPVVSTPEFDAQTGVIDPALRYENLGELPRTYGEPTLFAIARDPQTIFAYWEIDWARIFDGSAPQGQKVVLRLLAEDGTEAGKIAVEPLASTCCLAVPRAGVSYNVELGYVDRAGNWNSVATAEAVSVPLDGIAEDLALDVVTIPLHMRFQRMVDLFRASKYDGQALTEVLESLQTRSLDANDANPLARDEEELLRATGWRLTEAEANDRAAFQAEANRELDERLERILGFGPSSAKNGFGGSSRA